MRCASLLRLVDGLTTAHCLHCKRVASDGPWFPFLCRACVARLVGDGAVREIAPGVPSIACFRYAGPARSLIRALKFEGVLGVGARLGHDMRELLVDLPPGPVDLLPVPLHWTRRWMRGHNQSATLVRAMVGARPGFRVGRGLRRRRHTAPQVDLGGADRERNVVAAFATRSRWWGAAVRPVALVDDVITTGATIRAALRVLQRSGVPVLGVYAAARVIRVP